MDSSDSRIEDKQDSSESSSPGESTSEASTKSSSDDCCWIIFKRRLSAVQLEDIYSISSTVQQKKTTCTIPEIRYTSPSPPSGSPQTSRLAEIRQKRMAHKETPIIREVSLDPFPRDSYVIMSRYSVQLRGFPVTKPDLVYTWLIDFCEELHGYRALHLSPTSEEEVYVEFSGLQEAKYAASALNGRQITETRVLIARVIVLPQNSKKVTLMETQV